MTQPHFVVATTQERSETVKKAPEFTQHKEEVPESIIGYCMLCGSEDHDVFAEGYDYEIETCNNAWCFKKCDNCGHLQLDPRPHVQHLAHIYPKTYYAYSMTEKLNPLILWGKKMLDVAKLAVVLRLGTTNVETYLDVGCGDGRYLKIMQERYHVPKTGIYGLDLDDLSISELKREGFQVYQKRVEDLVEIRDNSVDLITMFHVIEHVDDPNAVIKSLAELLKEGGQLAIETPNFKSFDTRLFQKSYWGGYHFPRHWHLFCRATMTQLLEKNGLAVVNVSFQTGHSFWLYSFHHLFKYKLRLPSVARLFDPMRSRLFLIAFTIFDKIRAKLGLETSAMLFIAQKKPPR